MKLIPRVGFDQVKLGIDRTEAERLLGMPDRVEENDWEPRGDVVSWTYDDLAVALDFDKDVDFRLARITSFSPEAVLLGKKPVGLAEAELPAAFPDAELDWETEDAREYVDPLRDVALRVEDGQVVEVTLSPEYDPSGDEPLWPA